VTGLEISVDRTGNHSSLPWRRGGKRQGEARRKDERRRDRGGERRQEGSEYRIKM